MTETPTTYDCGMTCSCDAVTELASERTELMEEMAAALVTAEWALRKTLAVIDAVLAKYRGEGGDASG